MSQSQYEDDLFDSRKNQYSTFIQELEQSTEKLMNEVFNAEYIPHINEEEIIHDKFNKSLKNNKPSLSTMSSIMSDGKKSSIVRKNAKNIPKHNYNHNQSKQTVVTKCASERQMTESFVNFLTRNDKWKERRIERAHKQISKKEEDQLKTLSFIPSILRGSKQKLQPIYERCLDIQKQKDKKLAVKRIQKERNQTQKQSQYTFQPEITTKAKNRTLDEYLRDKEDWVNKKQEYIENSKVIRDAMKYEECLFQPILVAKYNKKNNLIKKGEKVEDRLLRTLERSIEK